MLLRKEKFMSSVSSEVSRSVLFDYAIPKRFCPDGGSCCPEVEMSDEKILKSIDTAKLDFLIGQDKLRIKLPNEIIRRQQIVAASMSQGISPLTASLIDTYKGKAGRVLDVGCGIGLNCIKLLSKGWSVYALDVHKEVLKIFEDSLSVVKSEATAFCQIINKDITEIPLKERNLDLILANDVLSYLHPDALIPTIKKIYDALFPGAIFMGTFLVNTELNTDKDILLMANVRAFNVYSYTNPAIVSNIIRYAGFHMEVCSLHNIFPEPSHPARLIYFVARKL